MGEQYKCESCGNEDFKLYLKMYTTAHPKEKIAEIVCSKCGVGKILILKEDYPKKAQEH
jgi:predicted RNA-binding Zn-ribbon protein involved in translation (DUF1610 family)